MRNKEGRPAIYLACGARKQLIVPALAKHFDVIDAQQEHIVSIPLRLSRLRQIRRRLIVMVNGFGPKEVLIGLIAKLLSLPFFVRLRGGLWGEVRDNRRHNLLFILYYRACRRITLGLATGILPVSKFLQWQLELEPYISRKRIQRVYNVVDSTLFQNIPTGRLKAMAGLKDSDKVLLTITNFNHRKKYMALAHYAPAIVKALRERPEWVFVIAGKGCSFETGRNKILRAIPGDLHSRVRFTGYYTPITEAFADADLVVHLAFRETLGMAILEAQACGKPVIANDFGGMTELFRRQQSQCLIRENNDLYQALRSFMDDVALREQIGTQDRDRVFAQFNAEAIGNDFHKAISNILALHRPHKRRMNFFRRPASWWREIFINLCIGKLYYGLLVPNRGKYIIREDWDNLIILDACRYDLFKELAGCNTDYAISRGANTRQFLNENIVGNRYTDTVMVTANPVVDRLAKGCFYGFVSVWKDGWNDELHTATPDTVVRAALDAEKRYPDKRLIVWFVQPHYPFIEAGPTLGFRGSPVVTELNKKGTWVCSPWLEAEDGGLEISDIWQAYKKNLQAVLPYAFELAKKLTGKTIITSDHGEAFERIRFPLPITIAGHPMGGIRIPSLVTVPWLAFENNHRKDIRGGSSQSFSARGRSGLHKNTKGGETK